MALTFVAVGAYSEPVEHTYSTDAIIFVDPLLTGLTSVSGSFTYENGTVPGETVSAGFSTEGSTFYLNISALSGDANGNIFSDPQGITIVGDDKFLDFSPPSDIVTLVWDSDALGDATLSGFSFGGTTLVNVFIDWIEGQRGNGDFVGEVGQRLPSILPPALTTSGRMVLDFVDPSDVHHFAVFTVTVEAVIPADSDIIFQGQLGIVETDDGTSPYSGVPIGTNFFGAINRLTSEGFISDGTTSISFGDEQEDVLGLQVENDFVLDASAATLLNSLIGSSFVAGDLIDLISVEGSGDGRPFGGDDLIGIGLFYVLDPLAFDDESRNNYPPNPDDLLTSFFLIADDKVVDRLTISFDTFDNLSSDAIAIEVFEGETLVARNLTNPFTDGSFVPVSVVFDADGTLDLTFDGNPIFVDLPTGFTPRSSNRFGFGGRTGDGFEVNRVDNVSISVCSDTTGCPAPDAEYVNDFSASVGLASLFGDAVLDSGSVRLTDSINDQLGSFVIDDLVPGA
ncbi:MAG: hypothetical protein O7G86_03550, partial [Gammaproteobacteria bacterium]|nr:hypothetical protein [Gammaproteobacteria bacterium]